MTPPVRAAGRGLLLVTAAAICLAAGLSTLLARAETAVEATPPPVPEPRAAFFGMLRDARLVPVNVSEAWESVAIVVEADDLLRDPTLWNRMHFNDWDGVPEPLRTAGLERMITRYRAVTSGPVVWEAMTPEDWDAVPQPVRAMAYIRIAGYWTEHYRVGARVGLTSREAADTLATILMVESWFEHRAVQVDEDGNRDLGLPQASDYCRERLAGMYREGLLDFRFEESDYFNPWQAILAGAFWFDIMLGEARGDQDLAVRAYRKGIDAARRGAAEEYLENVKRKREQYIRNRAAPPAWDLLSRRLRPRRG